MRIPSRTGVTTGVTPGPRHNARPPSRRKIAIAGVALSTLSMSLFAAPGTADAALPSAPDSVVVFPNRDFITVEGFSDHATEQALIQVLRGTTVVGSAVGTVSGDEVAFEVNHPGGYCWGAGTDLNVTPDIQPGDKAQISFRDPADPTQWLAAGDTVTQDAFVTDPSGTAVKTDADTIVVKGHIGGGVNPANVEQRIVNPDLVDTSVARRDIRAVPGPMTAAPKGGYESQLVITNDTFTATYNFTGADALAVATKVDTGGGERFMAWQAEQLDPAGQVFRQGLTIAEAGEPGGPGMGGCPAGPGEVPAPVPGSAAVVRTGTSMSVTWSPESTVAGAPQQVSGYQVTAMSADGSILGKRVGPGVTTAVIDSLGTGNYDVEVRSMVGDTLSGPYKTTAAGSTNPSDGTVGTPVTVPLTLSATSGTVSSVTATTSPGSRVFFTLGTDPILDPSGFFPGPAAVALPASGVLTLKASGTVNFVAFDAGGNHSDPVTGTYTVAAAATPTAPSVTASAGERSANVSWTVPAGETNAKYVVDAVVTGTTSPVVAGKEVLGSVSSTSLTGLTAGTNYTVRVVAVNAAGVQSAAGQATVTPKPPAIANITVTRAQWKAGSFRIQGTTTATPGTTITVTGIVVVNGASRTVTATAPAVAGALPTDPSDWRIDVRTVPGTVNFASGTALPKSVSVTAPGAATVNNVPVTNG
jgi:hypothetical protein